ncbi:hypothetical protein DPMN_023979 [Dreissena polymorpha]|uniref:Uncharacterized protein n=1 Tax=Dreissena polymorpha TaxID=45954 RepID=A0A9D4LLU1_DREPO|nr:hypothetical protein DPMN_023979 [Dreissena polymorpha]
MILAPSVLELSSGNHLVDGPTDLPTRTIFELSRCIEYLADSEGKLNETGAIILTDGRVDGREGGFGADGRPGWKAGDWKERWTAKQTIKKALAGRTNNNTHIQID